LRSADGRNVAARTSADHDHVVGCHFEVPFWCSKAGALPPDPRGICAKMKGLAL
jgi:hypothetical protein